MTNIITSELKEVINLIEYLDSMTHLSLDVLVKDANGDPIGHVRYSEGQERYVFSHE